MFVNWYRKLFSARNQRNDPIRLLKLRCTRFRQLVRNYGKILDAIADAADKQGGGYILDRQYTVSLSEVVVDLTEAIVFDLNIIAEQRYESFYQLLDRFQAEIREIVTAEDTTSGPLRTKEEKTADDRTAASTLGLNKLAKAVADSTILYEHAGQTACGGIAAGPVFNLELERNPDALPHGAVMVASDVVPNDELIRLMRQTSAILTDFGEPAGDVATLAREFGIPTIVGLGDASQRLETGIEITVDADENTVYLGRIQELLEYYETERQGHEEEPEYRTLRRLRRFMFPLTLDDTVGAESRSDDCKTLHDLAHLAHELAGEAQYGLIMNVRGFKNISTDLRTNLGLPFFVVDVGDGLLQADPEAASADLEDVRSLPLRVFALGLDQMFHQGPRTLGHRTMTATVTAIITEEHADILVKHPGGFDLVDSMIGESKESNYIYCRFASTNDNTAARGAFARDVFSRLDFAAARTARTTAAWLSGIPRTEMEERLTIVGRLGAFLLEMDADGWEKTSRDELVDTFMTQYV
jgi:pyruvate,water dikinase